jgi:hypothetical protein
VRRITAPSETPCSFPFPLFFLISSFSPLFPAIFVSFLLSYFISEICDLLGCYAALSGSSAPTSWDNVSIPSSGVKKNFFFLDLLTVEDGADRLSRNVDTDLSSRVKKSKNS